MIDKINNAKFIVEATATEQKLLKEIYSNANWINNQNHITLTVGYIQLDGTTNRKSLNIFPVTIKLTNTIINNIKIIFYEATSNFIDWNMITNYINENYIQNNTKLLTIQEFELSILNK